MKRLASFEVAAPITAASWFDAGNSLILAGGVDLWQAELENQQVRSFAKVYLGIRAIGDAGSGQVMTLDSREVLSRWDVESGRHLQAYQVLEGGGKQMQLIPGSDRVVTTDDHGHLCVVNLDRPTMLSTSA